MFFNAPRNKGALLAVYQRQSGIADDVCFPTRLACVQQFPYRTRKTLGLFRHSIMEGVLLYLS